MNIYPIKAATHRRCYIVKTASGEQLAVGDIDPERYVKGPYATLDDAEEILRIRRAGHVASEWLTVGLLATALFCLVVMMPSGGW